MIASPKIPIPETEIRSFCRRWQIVELSLFGSVLREDFQPDSDVDGGMHTGLPALTASSGLA